MKKWYKMSIVQTKADDNGNPAEYKEIKIKCLVCEDQTEDTILNHFAKIIPQFKNQFNEMEYKKIKSNVDKEIAT